MPYCVLTRLHSEQSCCKSTLPTLEHMWCPFCGALEPAVWRPSCGANCSMFCVCCRALQVSVCTASLATLVGMPSLQCAFPSFQYAFWHQSLLGNVVPIQIASIMWWRSSRAHPKLFGRMLHWCLIVFILFDLHLCVRCHSIICDVGSDSIDLMLLLSLYFTCVHSTCVHLCSLELRQWCPSMQCGELLRAIQVAIFNTVNGKLQFCCRASAYVLVCLIWYPIFLGWGGGSVIPFGR